MDESYDTPKLDYKQLFLVIPDEFNWVKFVAIDGDGSVWEWENEPSWDSTLREWGSQDTMQYYPNRNSLYLGSSFLYSNVPAPEDSLLKR